MKDILSSRFFAALLLLCIPLALTQPASAAAVIQSRTADVEGGRLHYLTAGDGEALILVHGYTQTSRMWRPVIPRFAEKFRVIAPDLPGIGDSAIPKNGANLISAATQIHALVASLGVRKVRIVGHDIGLMVSYAYAAQFPDEVEKLVVMDAFIPGAPGWEEVYNNPHVWHFRFNGDTPAALVHGRERIYFDYYWNEFAFNRKHSIPESDRKAYVAAYARPGRLQASWAYFASWPQTAKDFARLAEHQLTMPVLAIGGDKANGEFLASQMKVLASDLKVLVLKDTGHWVLEERPKETLAALLDFL